MGGLTGQAISPEHGEAGTGLCGASAVLSDTLVDRLVILADTIYRQCAVRREEEERCNRKKGRKENKKLGSLVSLTHIYIQLTVSDYM